VLLLLEGHSAAICIFAIDIVIIPTKDLFKSKKQKIASPLVVAVV
jgi:hypothetical protein